MPQHLSLSSRERLFATTMPPSDYWLASVDSLGLVSLVGVRELFFARLFRERGARYIRALSTGGAGWFFFSFSLICRLFFYEIAIVCTRLVRGCREAWATSGLLRGGCVCV